MQALLEILAKAMTERSFFCLLCCLEDDEALAFLFPFSYCYNFCYWYKAVGLVQSQHFSIRKLSI